MAKENSRYHQCQNCGYAFSDPRQLEHHLKVYDEALEDVAINAGKVLNHFPITHEIVCPLNGKKCRNARFTRFQDFASHYNTHLECKNKECPGCATKFTRCSQIMAHSCTATDEDPKLKKGLAALKESTIERNLFEAKQAQLAFREKMLGDGQGFLKSTMALRLMVKALVPKSKTEITTKIRDELGRHIDSIIDSVTENIQTSLHDLSVDDPNLPRVAQSLHMDHYRGTRIPEIDPAERAMPLKESGFYLVHDRITLSENSDEPRKLLPRDTDRTVDDIAPTSPVESSTDTGPFLGPTARRAGRRVVRGKPRPGVKGPRPKINGPPRIRDKSKNRITKPGRRGKQDSGHMLDGILAREYRTKKERMSPSDDSEPSDSDEGGGYSSYGKLPDADTALAGLRKPSMHPDLMTTDVHIYHATITEPTPGLGAWSGHTEMTGMDTSSESTSVPLPAEPVVDNTLPTPRSISPTDGTTGLRPLITNPNYGGAVPSAHIEDQSLGSSTGAPRHGEVQDQASVAAMPLVDGLPYHLRRGSAPALGRSSNHTHLDGAAAIPRVSDGAFMANLTSAPMNGFMVGWNDVTYQQWPTSNLQLVDPLAQSVPPGMPHHPPMPLSDSTPEAFLSATTMTDTMSTMNTHHRLSFDSQTSYMAASSNHSSSYDNRTQSNFHPGPGHTGGRDAWNYAPSDEKTGFNFAGYE